MVLLLLASLLAGSCQQPTSDPDQAVRDLIVAHHWISDPAYQPPFATPDPAEFQVLFDVVGAANIDAGSRLGSWTYAGGVFTLHYTDTNATGGTAVTETTSSPTFTVTKTSLQFNYLGGLCHLIPVP